MGLTPGLLSSQADVWQEELSVGRGCFIHAPFLEGCPNRESFLRFTPMLGGERKDECIATFGTLSEEEFLSQSVDSSRLKIPEAGADAACEESIWHLCYFERL